MDITALRVIATVLSFAAFIGILVWVFAPSHAKGFAEAARLPFADEDRDSQ